MRLKFGKRIYEMEDPIPGADELLVRVDQVIPIEYKKHAYHQVFSFKNPIRKLLFFLWREGFFFTLNKTRTSLLMKKILTERKLVVVQGYCEERPVLALGPQDCTRTDTMIFPENLVSPFVTDGDLSRTMSFIINHLKNNEELFHDLFYYSPFSGRSIDFNLNVLLRQYNKAESIPEEAPKPFFRASDLNAVKTITRQPDSSTAGDDSDLFVIGAGVYTYSHILPHCQHFRMNTIIDAHSSLAAFVGDKFRFNHADNSVERGLKRLSDARNPVAIISTYHSSHIPLAEMIIENNPETRIMIEKPPVTTREQLLSLVRLRKIQPMIDIGYNRRYAAFTPMALQILNQMDGPVTVTCIVKEKSLPMEHWYYWPNEGSRVTGNLSHWIDLGVAFIQQRPVRINAISASSRIATDEPAISVIFEDSSCLNLIASDRGDSTRGVQELIDIRKGDLTIRIDDFIAMDVLCESGGRRIRRRIRDKGHATMYKKFVENCVQGRGAIYSDFDLIVSSLLYLDITEILQNGQYTSAVDYSDYLQAESLGSM